jgi:dihydroorotate dehydrogenase electron transfer subunit
MSFARICRKERFGERFVCFELEEGDIASQARPGQFVMVRPSFRVFDPLLPRPFAVLSANHDRFSLLFEVVGKGTELLSYLEVGDVVEVLGPLGRGFSLDAPFGILLAGGRGLVPLVFLAREFEKRGIPFSFFLGVRKRKDLALLRLLEDLPRVLWSCEEAVSGGFCGTVLDLVGKCLERALWRGARIYACGPEGMLRELATVFPGKEEDIEVALEARMGCGFGVCLGCAIPRRGGGYWHVCSDGPVFRLSEVVL